MFGFQNQLDQQEHENKIARINARSSVFTEIIKNTDVNKSVFLKNEILKLAYIIDAKEIINPRGPHTENKT